MFANKTDNKQKYNNPENKPPEWLDCENIELINTHSDLVNQYKRKSDNK